VACDDGCDASEVPLRLPDRRDQAVAQRFDERGQLGAEGQAGLDEGHHVRAFVADQCGDLARVCATAVGVERGNRQRAPASRHRCRDRAWGDHARRDQQHDDHTCRRQYGPPHPPREHQQSQYEGRQAEEQVRAERDELRERGEPVEPEQ
jgi:hypothetical protein